jgi:hypothetical protein
LQGLKGSLSLNAVRIPFCLAWVLVSGIGEASAQSIYTCVDGKGRQQTSDRPIPECVDREQRELNSSGTVRRHLGPTLTAQEQVLAEEKARKSNTEQNRRVEERRRAVALLARYPDQASHERVRAEALVQFEDAVRVASKHIAELGVQRKPLDTEMEFFKRNPAKAPLPLKRQLEENDANVTLQKRFIADQEAEKNRVQTRFDEELTKLKPLWQASASASR